MGRVVDPTDHTKNLESMLELGRIEPGEYTVGEVLFVPGHTPTLVLDPDSSLLTTDEIAQVCHEANRALQLVIGDPVASPAWGEAPESQRESAIEGVAQALAGATPEQLHQSWCDNRLAAGWTFGDVKDEESKTHPCLVPYEDLPPEQRLKDALFGAVVRSLAGGA